ncbi:MAG TPA: hypothetical protein VJH95_01015 [Candidatus Nanoarchaeia archaeon]|nr:hypothetical protein [Candidatus Nanoarchaeia archaeon]
MSIEFVVDTVQEEEKEKLKKIIEVIKKRPVKLDKNAWFLRKFTLALMGQYPKKEMLKHHEEMLKRLREGNAGLQQPSQVQQIRMPEAPERLSLEIPIAEAPQPLVIIPEAPQRI